VTDSLTHNYHVRDRTKPRPASSPKQSMSRHLELDAKVVVYSYPYTSRRGEIVLDLRGRPALKGEALRPLKSIFTRRSLYKEAFRGVRLSSSSHELCPTLIPIPPTPHTVYGSSLRGSWNLMESILIPPVAPRVHSRTLSQTIVLYGNHCE